ncbi:MAG TPA: BON domain-containing protein [Acidimicrobiales bacterium]|nr:BON domain-containing protein [Acidimicrobiales bacterium]
MIWLLWKLITLPVRLVLLALRVVLGTVRVVGVDRIAAFGAGVAAGTAMAPRPGTQLRAGVAQREEQRAARGGDIGVAVRHELATSPRTWHLPQPGVTVQGDRVRLTGTVPHDQARLDLVRTAGSIAGVRAVDDDLVVEGEEPVRS